MTLHRIVARVLALGAAYFSVSLLERMTARAEEEAAAARMAAHAADAALFEHLTGDGCTFRLEDYPFSVLRVRSFTKHDDQPGGGGE